MPLHYRYFQCLCTRGIFNARYNNTIFIPVTLLTTDTCHVNGDKHGTDLYIVGSYSDPIHVYSLLLCNAYKKVKCYIFVC